MGGVMLGAMAIVLPIGWKLSHSLPGIKAGTMAAGVCLFGGWAGIVVSSRISSADHLLARFWLGILVRMGVPLAAALVVHFSGGPLADGGFLYYIMAFYPVTLTSEVLFSLPDAYSNQ